jgi:hypothetical protein
MAPDAFCDGRTFDPAETLSYATSFPIARAGG